MFDLGTQELMVIFIVAFLVFGPKRLPELARTLGKGLRELKTALRGVKDSIEEAETSVSKEVEEAKTGIEESIAKGIQLEDSNEEEAENKENKDG